MLACSSDVAMQTLMIKTLRDNRKDYLELDDTHLFVDPTCVALLRQALDQLHEENANKSIMVGGAGGGGSR